MIITVTQKKNVKIVFKGKVNMSQTVTLSPEDAKKLAKALQSTQSTSFKTE